MAIINNYPIPHKDMVEVQVAFSAHEKNSWDIHQRMLWDYYWNARKFLPSFMIIEYDEVMEWLQ